MKRIVVCMKWGTLFDAKYVNVLFSAVKAHLPSMDDFICITENASGLHADIKAQPIPDMPLDPSYYAAGAWPKLSLFKIGVLPKDSQILFIDLDMMICGDLTRFFELPSAFYACGGSTWGAPPKSPRPAVYVRYKEAREHKKALEAKNEARKLGYDNIDVPPNTMGSQVFTFYGDTLNGVWDNFIADPVKARALHINEQHFLERNLDAWTAWPAGWVIHYKYNLRQPLVKDIWTHPSPPPPTASIVSFSGRPRPHELAERYISSLKEFPHVRFGRVEWFKDYWDHHGSTAKF